MLRGLITLLGAGLGMAAVVGVVVLTRWLYPEETFSVMHLAIGYVSMGLVGSATGSSAASWTWPPPWSVIWTD